VRHSGFELVAKRPRKGKLATEADIAKLDWKPWKQPRDGKLIPSDLDFARCGVPARMAFAVMLRTRDDLIGSHSKVEHTIVDKMMANFAETAEWLKSIVAMIDLAYMRVLASAAAYNARGGKFKGVS
jgi:hypothetical protein